MLLLLFLPATLPLATATFTQPQLDTSLADIDHRGRSGGQRFLLPVAVTRADLKPIVEEQGFHLLVKDIAQGRAKRLFHVLTSWMEKREMADVVLDLGHGIVVLLFSSHELPSIRHRVLRRVWMADFQEISWGRIACFKEKTSLREHMFPDASQHRFLVLSRQKELKDIFQHVNERKLLLEMERARISHHPFNGDGTLSRFLARSRNHFWHDIHTCDLIALRSHAKGHTSGSTRKIQKRPSKRARPLLGQWIILFVALVFQIIGLWISKLFKIIMINHHCPFRALMVRHRIYSFSEKYTRWGADSRGVLVGMILTLVLNSHPSVQSCGILQFISQHVLMPPIFVSCWC